MEKAFAERSRGTRANADRVLCELPKLVFVNLTDVINMDEAITKGDANRD